MCIAKRPVGQVIGRHMTRFGPLPHATECVLCSGREPTLLIREEAPKLPASAPCNCCRLAERCKSESLGCSALVRDGICRADSPSATPTDLRTVRARARIENQTPGASGLPAPVQRRGRRLRLRFVVAHALVVQLQVKGAAWTADQLRILGIKWPPKQA
jgi:hypothetical protein